MIPLFYFIDYQNLKEKLKIKVKTLIWFKTFRKGIEQSWESFGALFFKKVPFLPNTNAALIF